ncbi:unnamed protein product, partial [Cyprideis torosa]
MLITPASTALLLSDKLKTVIFLSACIGLLSAVFGFLLAIVAELPPGPAMVVVATLLYILTVIVAPEKGLIIRYVRKKRQQLKIIDEDIIRQTMKYPSGIDGSQLAAYLHLSTKVIRQRLTSLYQNGFVQSVDPVILSAKGMDTGNQLIRAHRLWESYQVEKMGLTKAQIHDEADRLEHFLTRAVVDEVDHNLGYPQQDPHGSPIPQKMISPEKSLLDLKPKSKARIA